MTTMVWLPFLVRAATTALLVVTASVAAEAAGPFWGALIASLPVSSGPAYVFLALQHDPAFIAGSALTSFATNAATGLLLVVYGVVATRLAALPALALAVLVWFAAAVAIDAWRWTAFTASLLNLVVYGAGFAILRSVAGDARVAAPLARRRWFELPVRAGVVAGFVTLVVALSSLLGPAATGIFAVFPISLLSLIVILRPRIGAASLSLLAANALRPMLGFGVMLLVLHLAVPRFGVALALCLALLVFAGWSAGVLALNRRRPR